MTQQARPGLPPHRRHQRVGHAGRRRQGEGAQGGRPAGDRLRRRRARLPDPRLHRRGGGRGLPRTRAGTGTPRPAGCPSCARRSPPRRCATPATRCPPPRCWSPTAASRRSTRRSPPCSTPATRCCCRRRTGRPTPSRSGWPAACRSRCSPTRPAATWPRVEQLEAASTARTKVLLFVSPSNPTGAVYSPDQVEAIGRWALERGLWVVTDEIYEHLVYGDATLRLDPDRWCPSSPTGASWSTGSPRPTR